MAWVDGTHTETFVLEVPFADVAAFFCDPAVFKAALNEIESGEQVEENVWHWILVEKNEKGIKFKGVYIVEYEREGDTLSWSTREGTNMTSTGSTTVRDLGAGQTEIEYTETIATDLPMPKFAAKMFRPIVSKNIASGVGGFLERSRAILERA